MSAVGVARAITTKSMIARAAACVLASILLIPQVAFAFTGNLSGADIGLAVQTGKNIAKRGVGFNVKKYTIAQETNGIDIAPGSIVDAVVLRTPFEHIVYESYLRAFEGKKTNRVLAQKLAEKYDWTAQIVIYAHSPRKGPNQRGFLGNFHDAVLVVGGHKIRPEGTGVSGLAEDFFDVKGQGREFRWLGARTYTFDLSAVKNEVNARGCKFSFDDSVGRQHIFSFKLSEYK